MGVEREGSVVSTAETRGNISHHFGSILFRELDVTKLDVTRLHDNPGQDMILFGKRNCSAVESAVDSKLFLSRP
jgi:hypothetical protein